MKTAAIDDLLGDTYAVIWHKIGPVLRRAAKEAGQTAMDISTSTESAQALPVSSPPAAALPNRPDSRNVMSLTNVMHFDGASDMQSYTHPDNFQRPLTHQYRPITPPRQTPTHPPVAGAGELTLTLTPSKPRARLISRREILKRASDTVAGLKPTASLAAAVASTKQANSGTGSPMLAAEGGGRSRRGGGAGGDERSVRIVVDGDGDGDVEGAGGLPDAGADSDVEVDAEAEREVEAEAEAEDGSKGSGDASRRGSVLERDGNDADDESGSDANEGGDADAADVDAEDDDDHEMQDQEPGQLSSPPRLQGFAAAMQDKRMERARDGAAEAANK